MEKHALGNLRTLLRWHLADPVDDAERARNAKICADYQGNRNPFVDFPELVERLWPADAPDPTCTSGCDGSSDSTPSLNSSPLGCLHAGDVAIVGLNADTPDTIALVALADLPSGTKVLVTDNGWTGSSWRDTEGVLLYTVGTEGVPAGTVLTWTEGASGLAAGGSWSMLGGSFSLSVSGDSVIVYQQCEGMSEPNFLFGIIYTSGGWTQSGGELTSASSVAPAPLTSADLALTLPHKDNYVYSGSISGSRSELQAQIMQADSWTGDDGATMTMPSGTFDVVEPVVNACPGLSAGDVAVIGFNADTPDAVALVVLVDLPGSAEVLITDRGWTGSEWRSGEGTLLYTAGPEGVQRGTVLSWVSGEDGSASGGSWSVVDGSFALSASGDSIIVYQQCEGNAAPNFLFGLSYTSGGWSSEGDALDSSSSLAPAALVSAGLGLVLAHKDNYVYSGVMSGTRGELLAQIMQPASWTGDNAAAMVMPSSRFSVFSMAAGEVLLEQSPGPPPTPAPPPSPTPDLVPGHTPAPVAVASESIRCTPFLLYCLRLFIAASLASH